MTAIAAFVTAATPALALLPSAIPMFITSLGQYGLIIAWFIVAGFAYGINESVNYSYRRLQQKTETELVKSGKLDKLIEEKVNNSLEKSNNTN